MEFKQFETPGSYEIIEYSFTTTEGVIKNGLKVIYYTPSGMEYTIEEYRGDKYLMPGFLKKP